MKKMVELVEGIGYVHTRIYSDESCSSWIVARSKKHADRLMGKLNWCERSSGPGGFFRHTNYNPFTKRLMTYAGYDV